jgi:hypothetical protein
LFLFKVFFHRSPDADPRIFSPCVIISPLRCPKPRRALVRGHVSTKAPATPLSVHAFSINHTARETVCALLNVCRVPHSSHYQTIFIHDLGKRRWKGCKCAFSAKGRRICREERCPCFANNRECDPELCGRCQCRRVKLEFIFIVHTVKFTLFRGKFGFG